MTDSVTFEEYKINPALIEDYNKKLKYIRERRICPLPCAEFGCRWPINLICIPVCIIGFCMSGDCQLSGYGLPLYAPREMEDNVVLQLTHTGILGYEQHKWYSEASAMNSQLIHIPWDKIDLVSISKTHKKHTGCTWTISDEYTNLDIEKVGNKSPTFVVHNGYHDTMDLDHFCAFGFCSSSCCVFMCDTEFVEDFYSVEIRSFADDFRYTIGAFGLKKDISKFTGEMTKALNERDQMQVKGIVSSKIKKHQVLDDIHMQF